MVNRMSDIRKTPAIRFKGFTDAWEQYKLVDLGFFKSNGVDKLSRPNETPVNLLNYMDVYSRRKVSSKNAHELMQVTAKPSQLIENSVLKNDVFFTPTSETPEDIGRVYVTEETLNNTVYSYHLMRFRPNQGTYYPNFPNYSLMTENVRKQFFLSAKGVQRYVISKADFESIVDTIPEYKEQKKIGEFFRSIDSLITLHQRKYEKLQQVKKALLEKMFPKEGEVAPKIRFSGFTDAWERCELGNLTDLYVGSSFTQELSDDGKFIVMDMGSVSQDGFRIELKRTNFERDMLKKDDLVMPKDDIGGGLIIGKTAHIPTENTHLLGDHVFRLRFIEEEGLFMHYLINSSKVNSSLKKKVTGSAQLGIRGVNIKNEIVNIPSVEEQAKIGHLFNDIDNLITLHQRKYEKLQNIKKALLQKMFV